MPSLKAAIKHKWVTSLVVQWLRSHAFNVRNVGLIPEQGSKIPGNWALCSNSWACSSGAHTLQIDSLCTTAKTQRSQINKYFLKTTKWYLLVKVKHAWLSWSLLSLMGCHTGFPLGNDVRPLFWLLCSMNYIGAIQNTPGFHWQTMKAQAPHVVILFCLIFRHPICYL